VGARDLAECLALQLKAMDPDAPPRQRIELVSRHLDVLAARDFNRLRRLLGLTRTSFAKCARSSSRSTQPGRAWGEGDVRYVVPDVMVRKVGGRWLAQLNRDAMRAFASTRCTRTSAGSRDNGAGTWPPAPGGALAHQERAAAVRHHPRVTRPSSTGRRTSSSTASRHAPLVLREIADAVACMNPPSPRDDAEVHAHHARHLRAEVLFGSHVATDTAAHALPPPSARSSSSSSRPRTAGNPFRPPHFRHPRAAGNPGRAKDGGQVREAMHIQPRTCESRYNGNQGTEPSMNSSSPPSHRDHVGHSRLRRRQALPHQRHFDHVIDVNVIMSWRSSTRRSR